MHLPAAASVRRRRGSALIVVVFLGALMAVLTTSLLRYTINERRNNERQRLVLRARNMAENVSVYAAEQLTIKLMRTRTTSPRQFTTGMNEIHLPPDDVLTTAFSTPSSVEVRSGLTASGNMTYINPATDPTNPNAGLHVQTSTVPIVAKAAMTHPQLGTVTAHCEHTMEIAMIPLFQFGMFYNMDLELFPGQDMTIAGPVHTNGRLMARGEIGGSANVTFTSRVTAALGLYADGQIKTNYRNRAGSFTSGAGGSGAVNYTSSAGTQTNLYGSSKWRDHKFGATSESATTLNQFKTFATSTYSGFVRTNVHGVTPLELPSIGTYKEADDPATTGEDERNNGRQIIEPPNPLKYVGGAWTTVNDTADLVVSKFSRKAGLYIVVNPDDERRTGRLPDGNPVLMLPHTYRCYLNTHNTDGTQTIREVVLPGQPFYGYNDNGTPGDLTDDSMYRNTLPNRYCTNTIVGSNQVLRIGEPVAARTWDDADGTVAPGSTAGYPNSATVTLASFPDAIFYDLRRAQNWRGYPYNRSATNAYTPRPIAKIDFDMTRFKLMVDRTLAAVAATRLDTATMSTGYNVGVPTATNWSTSIFNSGSSMSTTLHHGVGASFTTFPTSSTLLAQDPFRIYFAPANPLVNPALTDLATNPSVYGAGGANLYSSTSPSPWFDGITVYLHSVDAEVRADNSGIGSDTSADADTLPDRIDSGVRLWNGRGPVATLAAQTGLSLVTNDALYIVGHYNADGAVNTTTSSTGNNGYSARWPDSAAEKLSAVMADAITLLSQPTFTVSSGNYFQVAGWSDALSAHTADNGDEVAHSASWATTDPSSSNGMEGIDASKKPGDMPNLSAPSAAAFVAATDEKMPTVHTEVSAALLMGLVPSNHNGNGLSDSPPSTTGNQQYSGGAHNFPRLVEDWHNQYGSTSNSILCIRGSMVALFESRVAMEPWNIRCYLAPVRIWGLHEGLAAAGHHVPLEPIVLNSRRMRYKELAASEYATWKTTIEALPNP